MDYVLISTYWNVNRLPKLVQVEGKRVLISTYWNVNIEYERLQTLPDNVLISTYWNVNANGAKLYVSTFTRFNLNLLECKYCWHAVSRDWGEGFNLNLLECKFTSTFDTQFVWYVLISTYWNVNTSTFWRSKSTKLVLISTYWNVNLSAATSMRASYSFNLNLLECKWLCWNFDDLYGCGFNLNLLECKSSLRFANTSAAEF